MGHDAFGGAVVEPPKKLPNLVETSFDQIFSGPARGLSSLFWSPSNLSLKRMHFAANNKH
jgi:hypothetical protein